MKLSYQLVLSGSGSALSNSVTVLSHHLHTDRKLVHSIRNVPMCEDAQMTMINASVARDMLTLKHYIRCGKPSPLNADEINHILKVVCTE